MIGEDGGEWKREGWFFFCSEGGEKGDYRKLENICNYTNLPHILTRNYMGRSGPIFYFGGQPRQCPINHWSPLNN